MSDSTEGPGWWQAADGKWYPPEQHPDFQAPTEAVPESGPPPTQAIPESGPPPTQAMPPIAPPAGGPPLPPPGPPPVGGPPPGVGSNNTRWIILGVVAAAIIAIIAFLLLRSDDDKNTVAANSSSPAGSTSSSSTSRSSTSSASKSSTSSSSSSQLTEQDIKNRLLKAKDIDPSFQDETFTPSDSPTPCGQPDIDSQVPPNIDVGSEAANGEAFFLEEVVVYDTPDDAKKALTLFKQGISCPQPTIKGGGPADFSSPKDVSSDIDITVEEAIEVDVQTEEAQGKFFAIRDGAVIVVFQFNAAKTADTTKLPDEIDIVNKGLTKLVS